MAFRLSSMSETRTLKFEPKPTGASNFSIKLRNLLTLPFRRVVPGVFCATLLWTVIYNVSVRAWKGPDHPTNRFRWRQMEKAGTLSPEMLHKKETIIGYYKSRVFGNDFEPIRKDLV
ncbi:hypothetical protein Q1695_012727 [Nippostrongylus brasiliensis]|nr:hypothetical protein Q1695_012727 [Nippostrongylus brasiliensis]